MKLTIEELKELKENSKPLLLERLASEDKTEIVNGNIVLKGDYYKKQVRIALKNCGIIDPKNIDDYIAMDGYSALAKILAEGNPGDVVETVKASGLRGRGGAGFPTGRKWEEAYKYPAEKKYIITNADEGDPGAFMDRSILENDPHAILEGMAIAGYAVGSDQGFIYVRAEYPIAVERLKLAIEQAKEYGLLGRNILGTDFSFDIELRLGAGAFVCGEGTALMESIEGRRGMPRTKIYRTAHRGLWQRPTIINNVETLANVPVIFQRGVEWFRSIGTEKSPGTKVFALVGKIENAGLVEVPMGMPLSEIVEIGGGVQNGKGFKAVQTGGPSGGCIPKELIETPVDFESLGKIGSIMGSGGMVVMDEDTCMVDIARFFLDFTVDESCGKCVPCRASNPVVTTIKYFRNEYEAHINDKKCPAHSCLALLSYFISDACIGCTKCARVCPVGCISGKVKERHVIDQNACIKCGACMEACPKHVKAVIKQ